MKKAIYNFGAEIPRTGNRSEVTVYTHAVQVTDRRNNDFNNGAFSQSINQFNSRLVARGPNSK